MGFVNLVNVRKLVLGSWNDDVIPISCSTNIIVVLPKVEAPISSTNKRTSSKQFAS